MPENLEQFKKKVGAIDSLVLKEDFIAAFKTVLDFFKKAIETLNIKYQEVISRTEIEVSTKLNNLTEKVDKKLSEVKDGEKGENGRNPLFVGKNPPPNPQKGDLWYRDD